MSLCVFKNPDPGFKATTVIKTTFSFYLLLYLAFAQPLDATL